MNQSTGTPVNITPQQMRALADESDKFDFPGYACTFIHQQSAALRTAANQLEAVRVWNTSGSAMTADYCEECSVECGAHHEHRDGHHD